MNCLICLEPCTTKSIQLSCDHTFHRRCVSTWVKSNASCPLCRRKVVVPTRLKSLRLPTLLAQIRQTRVISPLDELFSNSKLELEVARRLCPHYIAQFLTYFDTNETPQICREFMYLYLHILSMTELKVLAIMHDINHINLSSPKLQKNVLINTLCSVLSYDDLWNTMSSDTEESVQ